MLSPIYPDTVRDTFGQYTVDTGNNEIAITAHVDTVRSMGNIYQHSYQRVDELPSGSSRATHTQWSSLLCERDMNK